MREPKPETETAAMGPDELYEVIRSGDPITLLDLRNREEYEEWRIEGENVKSTNVPYIEFIQAEATDSVSDLVEEFSFSGPIVTVCGEGKASAYVADLLGSESVEAVNLENGMEGWAEVYVRNEVTRTTGTIQIYQYQRPSSGCLSYLLVDDDEAIVIDPLKAFLDRYIADAKELGCELTYVVDTHIHADHISGIRALASATAAQPILSASAVERGVTYGTHTVVHGDELEVGNTTATAVHTPGHTSGMTSFHIEDVLLTGDGLSVESIARPDLETGEEGASTAAAQLYETLHECILQLPDKTIIAPAHFSNNAELYSDRTYTAELGELQATLGVLEMEKDAFVEQIASDIPPRPANFETIIEMNLGQRTVDDEKAFELELGPNNCAAAGASRVQD